MPLEVKVIFLCTLAFLAVAFLLFLFILLSRLMDGIFYAQKRWMEKKAQQMITSYLFLGENWNKDRLRKFQRNYLTNSLFRSVFMNSLIALHKNILGESSEQLRFLYEGLGLKKQTERKLQSSSWHRVAKGICELAEMGTKEDIGLIRPFINHKNPLIQSEAQVALLKLETDKPFSFLDDLSEALPEWQQIHLIHAAENIAVESLPELSRWLSEKEESIVVFCIRMIAQFDQYQAGESLLAMLEHPYPARRLRSEIIMAIRHLELTKAEGKLRQLYAYENPDIQAEIEKTLMVIAGGEVIIADWGTAEAGRLNGAATVLPAENNLNQEKDKLLAG